ncbi:hypothetical protein [Ascidiaceihabitans sp.]|uniref:hypothetical protein n=1 Tax=Ascidiaceihabitans sp. TaxID=1872644 RepID=UPI00329A7115
MYQSTAAEFAALQAAKDSALLSGTAEYQTVVDALALTSDYAPGVPGSVPPEGILDSTIADNAGKPCATFYVIAAQFAEQGGSAADSNTIEWLRGAAGGNRGDTVAAQHRWRSPMCAWERNNT